jgi:hypothetical protein
MPEPLPSPDLLRSLGHLVRGLSALFWGLPAALVVCVYTARAEGLKLLGILPPMAATALVVYGLWQLADFQKQERVWHSALDRARMLALINFGLSPFLYWWYRHPNNSFFTAMVLLLAFSGLMFLACLNLALQRLGAMLPDETLRLEIGQYTVLNLNLLVLTLVLVVSYVVVGHLQTIPPWLIAIMSVLGRGPIPLSQVFFVVLLLLPLAMTMALIWKTKEVILDSIFGGNG